MCSTVTCQTTIENAHASVEKMLAKLAASHQATWGGDYNEWLAEANLAFVNAYRTWNPSHGRLTTWAWHNVRGHLLNLHRTKAAKAKRESLPADVGEESRFDLRAWLFELGEDARYVVDMVLESPVDLIQIMRTRDKKRPSRSLLKRFLRDLGWGHMKISKTFQEITEALS